MHMHAHTTHTHTHTQKLRKAGVVPGADMTTEAALTKLSCLLGQKLSVEEIKKQMTLNLSGELTVLDSSQQQLTLRDSEFLETIAKALSVSSSKVSPHYEGGLCYQARLWTTRYSNKKSYVQLLSIR